MVIEETDAIERIQELQGQSEIGDATNLTKGMLASFPELY